jgi:hypothetical protein
MAYENKARGASGIALAAWRRLNSAALASGNVASWRA